MITRGDDYPLHQTSRPVRDPDVHRNQYDRFFFNGYPRGGGAGRVFFAVAFGQYLGRNVCDGAFSVILDGVQHNIRASRLLGDERLDLTVGPVTIEIVEPLHQLRVRVDDRNSSGIVADLLFTSRGAVFEEPRYTWKPGHRTVFDITRMTQNGTWTGTIEHGSRTIQVDDWWGTRDRSWGIRPVGEPEVGAPDGPGRQYYWLWAPLNLPDENIIFDVNENADGTRWHENAMTVPVGGATDLVTTAAASYAITWKPGTRHAEKLDLAFSYRDGRIVRYELSTILTFFMEGIGYGHPQWGHGRWVGPDERSYDSRELTHMDGADLSNIHVQLLCSVRRSDGATGTGILEMMVIGPHEPSGFTGVCDPHS